MKDFHEYLIVCDCRENFPTYLDEGAVYNDHFKKANIDTIISTLHSLGYNAKFFGGVKELISAINEKRQYDNAIFLNFNDGLTHEHKRGQTPILLEILTKNYSGSDAFASLLASDKYYTNQFLSTLENVHVAKGFMYSTIDKIPDKWLQYPVIVKPNNEGSSIGIDEQSVCRNILELQTQIHCLETTFHSLLIEEYIPGFEFTVFIVGNEELAINQPLAIGMNGKYYFNNEVFSAKTKANHLRTYSSPDTLLSAHEIDTLKYLSKIIFKAMGLRDYARLDFRYNNGTFYLLEVNTVPAIGPTSDAGYVCNLLGIDFGGLLDIIVKNVKKRLRLNHA